MVWAWKSVCRRRTHRRHLCRHGRRCHHQRDPQRHLRRKGLLHKVRRSFHTMTQHLVALFHKLTRRFHTMTQHLLALLRKVTRGFHTMTQHLLALLRKVTRRFHTMTQHLLAPLRKVTRRFKRVIQQRAERPVKEMEVLRKVMMLPVLGVTKPETSKKTSSANTHIQIWLALPRYSTLLIHGVGWWLQVWKRGNSEAFRPQNDTLNANMFFNVFLLLYKSHCLQLFYLLYTYIYIYIYSQSHT